MDTYDPCGVCHGDGQVTDLTGLGMEPCGPCGGTGAARRVPAESLTRVAAHTLLQAMRDEAEWADGLEDADETEGHDPKAFAAEVERLISLFRAMVDADEGASVCFLQEQQMTDGRWLFAAHAPDRELAERAFKTTVALASPMQDAPHALRVGKWALVEVLDLWERR